MKLQKLFCLLFAVSTILPSLGYAQTSSTSLRGTITDPTGSVLSGATIVLQSTESNSKRTTQSGTQGDYQFLFLPPGTYSLKVTAPGFEGYEQTGLELLVNTPATTNVRLKLGRATEVVSVTSEAPVLNTVDASLGNSFDENQVRQIPLEGRNVPDLLSLQAGVAYTGNRPDIDKDQDSRNGAVNGARSDQSNITLDGVDVNDQTSGYAFTSVLPVTLDSVQEFRVTTSDYNADQGQGSGAQVALVTKSGTNSFHGSVYEYHRNTVTSANDYFVKQAELATGEPNKPDKLLRNIFGASVGGPIKKDRLFFFVNYEGTREREQQSTVRTIPTPSLCAGNIKYLNVNGGITTVTPAILAAIDPLTGGYNGQGPGINHAIENAQHTGYFDKTFCTGQFVTNDPSVGDGLNYSGFRFRAPVSLNNNAFIARLDYHVTSDGKHTLFWRGALQNIFNPQAPFLPGSIPEQTLTDHSKGFVVGYTGVLTPTIVNNFHWGFTRQSTGILGDTNQEWNEPYGLDQGIFYTHNAQTPVHNLLDDVSWTKGKHNFQFGTNIGFARDPRVSFEHSFSVGKGATNWMAPTGFANTGSPLDPVNANLPEPASAIQYDYPVLGLLGMVSDILANYNYDKTGKVLNYLVDAKGNPISPTGAPVKRDYGLNWYEFYGQDSFRIKSNLTVTYGVRWSLFPPPWEVNGYQASVTCVPAVNPTTGCPSWSYNLGTEFNQISQNMLQGIGFDAVPLASFNLGGPANNGRGFYNFSKSDVSPRISFAYSPRPSSGFLRSFFGDNDKSVIRGGFSRVYDRAGLALLSTFDANAPGGLAATVQNPCCVPGYDDAANEPRITNINKIPVLGPTNQQFFEPAPPGAFPQTPSATGQAITWGVDQSLKTPYAWAFDLSFARELPQKFSLQLSYVGRLGRHLLTQRDLRQPIDLVDPKTGIDYYAAATRLAQLGRQGLASSQVTDAVVGKTAAFWHDMIPKAAGYQDFFTGVPFGTNLVGAIYDLYYNSGDSYVGNEVVGLGNLDIYYGLADLNGNNLFFKNPLGAPLPGDALNNQATTMYAWSSIGNSNYNGLQASLRKQFSAGLQFDLNYTYSKSIDITSNATRLDFNAGAPGSHLVNAFDPNGNRAVSDFDTTHQINADWIADLPFGRGKRFASNARGVTNGFIGGWQLSGLARWTSGYPFAVDNGNFWPTDWDYQGVANMLVRPTTGHFKQPDGSVSVFPNSTTAFSDFAHPFPGQGGSRNAVRGDGFAGVDMALAKRWKTYESQSLQFRWEVFNVFNQVRFNALSGLGTQACGCIASLQQVPNTFGNYTGLLTQPRVMQFALRYEF